MIVVISGDCNTNHCKLTGLDIFAVRHPKLFNLVISRLGLVTDGSEQVGECAWCVVCVTNLLKYFLYFSFKSEAR